jgi:hypothetical protein
VEIVYEWIGSAPNCYESNDSVVFGDQNDIVWQNYHLTPMAKEILVNPIG